MAGWERMDAGDHRHPRLGLIERDGRRLFSLVDGHRRPLPRGTQNEQPLHAGFDVEIDELAHHLLIDAYLLIKRRNNWQQYSEYHFCLPVILSPRGKSCGDP